MNRAQAYELAKARGYNKSISAFGGQFTRNPQAVVCGIKRIEKGVFVEVDSEATAAVHSNDDHNSITVETQPPSLPLNEEKTLLEEPPPSTTSPETTQKDNSPLQQKSKDSPEDDSSSFTQESEAQDPQQPSETQETPEQPGGPNEFPTAATEITQKDQLAPKQDDSAEEKKSFRQQSDRPPRIRRKLYTANGTHQAICRFQGVLMPKPEGEKGFKLLLPGLEVEAHFAFSKTLWYYRQNPHLFEGVKNYIGYPKLTGEGKLVKIQIVAIDQQQTFQREQWEFIGMWCGPQKALFVQRQGQMFPDEERPHYYKYRFKNQDEYRKYLWDRYAYQIIAKREGDELLIVRNNPFACPRRKPEPPMRGKPPFGDRSASGGKPSFGDRPPSDSRPDRRERVISPGESKSTLPKPSGKPQPRVVRTSES
ncbi:hypothetical protein [Gloeothece verrucosa]|nr:hypothetical protein [Gloeothece verrucosa]